VTVSVRDLDDVSDRYSLSLAKEIEPLAMLKVGNRGRRLRITSVSIVILYPSYIYREELLFVPTLKETETYRDRDTTVLNT
jgi:hypothetical protein